MTVEDARKLLAGVAGVRAASGLMTNRRIRKATQPIKGGDEVIPTKIAKIKKCTKGD